MENSLNATICLTIKELRKKHGYSQEDMAIALNMQQNTYSRMERGETKLDIERLQRIASFYKIYVHDLLNTLPPPRKNKKAIDRYSTIKQTLNWLAVIFFSLNMTRLMNAATCSKRKEV